MNPDRGFEAILKKWGSEKAVYAFLKKEFDRINRSAFGGCLPLPSLQIEVERSSFGDYDPAERYRPAVIRMFSNMLMDEGSAPRALAHYMIHHWENTLATDNDSEDYPAAVDQEISQAFTTGYREREWRNGHSRRFISKAYDVAKTLSIPTREILMA